MRPSVSGRSSSHTMRTRCFVRGAIGNTLERSMLEPANSSRPGSRLARTIESYSLRASSRGMMRATPSLADAGWFGSALNEKPWTVAPAGIGTNRIASARVDDGFSTVMSSVVRAKRSRITMSASTPTSATPCEIVPRIAITRCCGMMMCVTVDGRSSVSMGAWMLWACAETAR